MTDHVDLVPEPVSPDDQPQDTRVSRRWVLNRFAWLTTAAAASGLVAAPPAVAAAAPTTTRPRVPAARDLRPIVLDDHTEATIPEIVLLLRRRIATPADIIAAYADRIEAIDPVLQAYADRPTRAQLLAAAAGTDDRDVLAGVGLAPKDNYYTADLVTGAGSLVYDGFVPDYDGTAIVRLREAGGVVLGKAQMGNLAGGRATVPGTNVPTTRNAWTPDDVRYSPSGSSSGTGAAVAARMATAGIGTQTGGSVTSPSQAEGITGLKPTFGRVSLHGVVPLTFTRDHVGPMAKTVMDTAILLQVLAGADPLDPRTQGLPEPPDFIRAATPVGGRRPRIRYGTRVGMMPGYLDTNNAEVAALRRAFVDQLVDLGADVVGEITLPDDWSTLQGTLGGSTAEPTGPFMEFLRDDVRLFGNRLTRFANGMFQSGDSYIKVQQGRFLLLERIMTQLFTQCDVCLVTSASQFDGPGLPLLALPIGFTQDGPAGQTVPEGALLAGPAYGEERLLAVGAAYQEVTDFHLRRPPEPSATAASARRGAPATVTTIQPVSIDPADEE